MYGGESYYWRGAATTNYLQFGGYCWRIVRINGDGTIRLIYDGTTCHQNGEIGQQNTNSTIIGASNAEKYYSTSDGQYNNSSYVGWTYVLGKQRPEAGDTAIDSNAKTQTENWYNTNLASYSDKIADGKFCNDRNAEAGKTWVATGNAFAYAGYYRIFNNRRPDLLCDANDIYNIKIGFITADEIAYAGALYNISNTSYYLYNGNNYWTMTPNYWDGSTGVFRITATGLLGSAGVHGTSVGIRPVINLKPNVTISSGNGTLNSPYVVV